MFKQNQAGKAKEVELPNLPTDAISQIAWSPVANYIAVGSWSGEVKVYEYNKDTLEAAFRAEYRHEGPVLCVGWSVDGLQIVSGGADKVVRAFDIASMTMAVIGQHDAPVRCIGSVSINNMPVIVSGGWDKCIKYWSISSPGQAVSVLALPERVYSMDIKFPVLAVATADSQVHLVDLNSNPTAITRTEKSPLKFQTRVVRLVSDKNGMAFVIGSIEGRIAVHYLDDANKSANFSFKCHRKDVKETYSKTRVDVYSVNEIAVHQLGTFATCGGEGLINSWDHVSRIRLKTLAEANGAVVSAGYNHIGDVFAYAISYDWSSGLQGNTPTYPKKVVIRVCTEEEVKPRVKK